MIARAEALKRHNVAVDAAAERYYAETCCDAVDQHRAGAAFTEAAAVFRSVQFEIVAQHVKQRGIGVSVDVVHPAVDSQADRGLRHAAGSRPLVALQNIAINPCEDTVCIQTCKPAVPSEAVCPVCKQDARAIELLFGNGLFSFQTRLTVFRHARNIVCIRTKCPAGEIRYYEGRLNSR